MADEEEFDLESSMTEVMKEITTEEDVEEEEVEEETGGPERDEKGRFRSKAEEPEEEAPVEEEPEVEEPEETIAAAPAVPPDLINPPPTWTAEAKAMWKDVPPRIRQEVMKREADSLRGVEQLRERATFGERLDKIIAPYRPLIQSEGATVESTVEGLMNTAYTLRQGMPAQKVQLTLEMAQRFGFLQQLIEHVGGNGQNTQQGGQINHVLAPLQSKIQDLEQKLLAKEQAERDAEDRRNREQAEHFINEVDEAGNLRHPYFENVREVMVGLLNAGSATNYEDAYQMAVWSHPETRAIVAAEQERQRQAKSQEDAKARAEKAKRAQTVNLRSTGTHGAGAPKQPLGSIDDTMRDVIDRMKSA